MGFPKPWDHKSPIIDQVMTMKLQHFKRHFSQKFSTEVITPNPLRGGSHYSHPPWDPLDPPDNYSGGRGGIPPTPSVRCWDPNMDEKTSLN